jgi:hypothetical protein
MKKQPARLAPLDAVEQVEGIPDDLAEEALAGRAHDVADEGHDQVRQGKPDDVAGEDIRGLPGVSLEICRIAREGCTILGSRQPPVCILSREDQPNMRTAAPSMKNRTTSQAFALPVAAPPAAPRGRARPPW